MVPTLPHNPPATDCPYAPENYAFLTGRRGYARGRVGRDSHSARDTEAALKLYSGSDSADGSLRV